MNDDGVLFGVDDLELWKKRGLPGGWLEDQKAVLTAHCHAQLAAFQKLLASADPATTRRLNQRL